MSQPLADDFVVTSVGMVTPVGHTAKTTCASIKAGLSRIAESPEFRVRDQKGHLVPVTCASVAGVTDGHRRFLRHYRLAVRAFAEAIGTTNLSESDLDESHIYLCICESERIRIDSRIEDQLMRRIARAIDVPDLNSRTQIFPLGHAAVFSALQAAFAALRQGRIRYAIVGAVDTYLDEAVLDWLAMLDRLKTDRTVNGMIPGEGAAFVVIERQDTALARQALPLARLSGPATEIEQHGIYADTPCRGDGLTSAIQQTLVRLQDGGADTAVVLCDLNGERYRASEWALTLGRTLGATARPLTLWHPATSTGDTGAAAGVINLAYGAMAMANRHVGRGQLLLWGSSDDGLRGSVSLQAIESAA